MRTSCPIELNSIIYNDFPVMHALLHLSPFLFQYDDDECMQCGLHIRCTAMCAAFYMYYLIECHEMSMNRLVNFNKI